MNLGETTAGTEENPHTIYKNNINDNTTKRIRIVHISDTHLKIRSDGIPNGDILIHSGDFGQFRSGLSDDQFFEAFNTFFKSVPHKHKIFVGGNHDKPFENCLKDSITEVIYLEDELVTIEGLRIYGSPWNKLRLTSFARAFTIRDVGSKFELIDPQADIVVTHQPPHNILDLASYSNFIPNFFIKWLSSGECGVAINIITQDSIGDLKVYTESSLKG